jgi:hypothetical protein
MAIWGCGSPACSCQPTVAGGLFMQISVVRLTITSPRRLCLLRVLLCASATATSFPLSKHTGGGDTAPAFSGLRVYLQFTWEVGLPPSPVEFFSHRHFYKLSHSWLLGVCCFSCLLQLACLFTVPWGIAPPPLQCSGCPSLFATCLFCHCFLFSFSFFCALGSVQGARLIWPRVVFGSTLSFVSSQAVGALVSCSGVGALLFLCLT